METKPFEQVMERFRALRIDEPFDMIVAIADRRNPPGGDLVPQVGLAGVFAAAQPPRRMPEQVVRSAEVAPPDRFRLCRQAGAAGRRPDQDRNDGPLCEGIARRGGHGQDLCGERNGRLLSVRRGLFSLPVGAVKSVFLSETKR